MVTPTATPGRPSLYGGGAQALGMTSTPQLTPTGMTAANPVLGAQPGRSALINAVMQASGGPAPLSTPGGGLGQGTIPQYLRNDLVPYSPTPGVAADDIARDTGNSTDPWPVVGNRNQPDKITMPITEKLPDSMLRPVAQGAVTLPRQPQAPQWRAPAMAQRPLQPQAMRNFFRPSFPVRRRRPM